MGSNSQRRSACGRRIRWLVGMCVCWLLSAVAWAGDPVDDLRKALAPATGEGNAKKLIRIEGGRKAEIELACKKLTTISELRRGYFLQDWPRNFMHPEREKLGTRFIEAVTDLAKAAAKEKNADKQLFLGIMIAELADSELPEGRKPNGRFASTFKEILVGANKDGLAYHENPLVRQAALHALGKIVPKASVAIPVFSAALQSPELGPRRLAAHGLSELVKNAHNLPTDDEIDTHVQVVETAVFVLNSKEADESIRGYCLQAILGSATAANDRNDGSPLDSTFGFKVEGEMLILKPGYQKLLKSYQMATSPITIALHDDARSTSRIRLTALQTLGQIGLVRGQILKVIQGDTLPTTLEDKLKFLPKEKAEEKKLLKKVVENLQKIADEALDNKDYLAKFAAPDPFENLIERDWVRVFNYLDWRTEKDIRLRRSAFDLLHPLADEVETALAKRIDKAERLKFVHAITPGLTDPDRSVRIAAVRMLGHIPTANIERNIIEALGAMLVDRRDRDPDLSLAAAWALESLAGGPDGGTKSITIGFLTSALIDTETDVENRIAAMRALASISKDPAHKALAQKAVPAVTSILADSDVRIRRMAAISLGGLGRPEDVSQAERAIAALRRAMSDDDQEVRLNASEAILNLTMAKKAL